MTYTIKYNRTTDHIAGLAEKTVGSGLNYAISACSSLSRNGVRLASGVRSDSLTEIMKDFGAIRKPCSNCAKAAKLQLEA